MRRSLFRVLESGVVKLEPDVRVNGEWTTVTHSFTRHRVEMLSNFFCKAIWLRATPWTLMNPRKYGRSRGTCR